MKKTLQECKEIVAKENGCDIWDRVVHYNTAIELLTDLANKMYYEQSEWIRVEDKLPKEDSSVWIYIKEEVEKAYFWEFCDELVFHCGGEECTPTHWAYCIKPSPPKK